MTQAQTREVGFFGMDLPTFILNTDPEKLAQYQIDLINANERGIIEVALASEILASMAKIFKDRCKDGLLEALSDYPEWQKDKQVSVLGWTFKNNGMHTTYQYHESGDPYLDSLEKELNELNKKAKPIEAKITERKKLLQVIKVEMADELSEGVTFFPAGKTQASKQPTIRKAK